MNKPAFAIGVLLIWVALASSQTTAGETVLFPDAVAGTDDRPRNIDRRCDH
jgi:hypothetical protein